MIGKSLTLQIQLTHLKRRLDYLPDTVVMPSRNIMQTFSSSYMRTIF